MTDTATGGESSGSSEETTSGGSGSETLGGSPAASAVGAVRRPTDGAPIGAVANTRAVSLSGTTAPGATVRVYDGGVLVATTTADASGAWTATATDLADGTHSYTTTVTDSSGNTSATSAVRQVAVDATAPVASPVAAVRRTDGAVIDARTNSRSAALSGTKPALL